MDGHLDKAVANEQDLDMKLFVEFNNAVQLAHFNHQTSPAFLKKIIKQAQDTSALVDLPNTRFGAKRVLRLLANALYKFRVLVGEEE